MLHVIFFFQCLCFIAVNHLPSPQAVQCCLHGLTDDDEVNSQFNELITYTGTSYTAQVMDRWVGTHQLALQQQLSVLVLCSIKGVYREEGMQLTLFSESSDFVIELFLELPTKRPRVTFGRTR